ncbi:bifunctional riboflavin kinase/FAD synthetase [Melioribacter sp. OK-6-Me]|uniref:bifunctional riboflavin kinase/FAD synthetase n=1 Tax=unclassified Melioribacter TaxID=2627329 RepID=UPI003ED972D6
MNIYKESFSFEKDRKTVVTVGSFDGLHLGHYKILSRLFDISEQCSCESVLFTFEPHPRLVISKDYEIKLLTTLNEKIDILNKTKLDNLVIQKFSREFSEMTSEEFIYQILVNQLNLSHIVIGHDHKFGRDRMGDAEKLRQLGKQYGFEVTAVEAEKCNGEVVSSTKIRNALAEGNIDKANLFLGRNYSFEGIVVKGAQRGRRLGFPTANIKLDNNYKALPANGVYAVNAFLNGNSLMGIMNIGLRPTFNEKPEITIEVHLINKDFSKYEKNIYGERLKVEVIKRIRKEIKFDSVDMLIKQIEDDKKTALQILSKFEDKSIN